MLGITQQGVRATATAQVTTGNAVKCIKPWGIADKWEDNSGTFDPGWDQQDGFNPGVDVYIPASSTSTTGFTLDNDKGMQLALKGDHGSWLAGWSSEIQFPGATGSSDYEDAIIGCPSFVPEVGFYAGQPCDNKDHEDPARGCLRVKQGVSQGPTTHGVDTLVGTTRTRTGTAPRSRAAISRRVHESFRSRLFDSADFVVNQASSCSGSNCVIKVVNIMGFFVEGVCKDVALDPTTYCADDKKDIVGRLVGYVGAKRGGAGNVPIGNSFILIMRLVR